MALNDVNGGAVVSVRSTLRPLHPKANAGRQVIESPLGMASAKTIAFVARGIDLRGVSVALFDYAHGAEAVLGHRSLILFDEAAPNDPRAVERFRRRFPMIACRDPRELDRLLARERADLAYIMKAGAPDGWVGRAAPTAVHAVFPTWPRDAHGDSYAYISRWLASYCAGGVAPYVPHLVSVAEACGDRRIELGIPADALVVGCQGGADSFDIPFARRALAKALERRRDLWFVGLNINPFLQHERARFLPGTSDPSQKRTFIETCDAMLHARQRGETFGLAVAEFSICNRAVLTFGGSPERAHLDMLGDVALVYRSERDLVRRLIHLDRAALASGKWDCYSRDYAFEPVMRKFADVFLDNPVNPARIRAARVKPENWTPGALLRYWRSYRRGRRGKGP
jgi:hypothetical protein